MDKFNDITKEVIDEGKFGQAVAQGLNTVQKAVNKMSQAGDILVGPGVKSNEYDSKKRYYPNIRSGAWRLIANAKIEDANQLVYQRIKQLKDWGTNLDDAAANIDSNIQPYVTNFFSKYFIDNEIDNIEQHYDQIIRVLGISDKQDFEGEENVGAKGHRTSSNPNRREGPSLKSAINNFRKTKSEADMQALRNSIDRYIRFIEGNPSRPAALSQTISFGYKTYVINALNDFKKFLDHYEKIFRASPGGYFEHVLIDTVEPIGGYIKPFGNEKDKTEGGKIYRDKWDYFLDIVTNAVIGALQRGWGVGATTYDIMIGAQQPKYTGRGGLQYSKNVQTVDPRMTAYFHSNIMTPLFLTGDNPSMLYLTPEQWESVMGGSKFYKAITSLGSEIVSAGANAPKVSL